jgi:hypothetical protein
MKFDDTKDTLLRAISSGLTYKDACAFAGISEGTFYNWKAKAEEAKSGKFFEFLKDIKKANLKAKASHLNNIKSAAFGGEDVVEERIEVDAKGDTVSKTTTTKKTARQWVASAWILERRFPEEFGRNRETNEEVLDALPWSDDGDEDPLGVN